MNRILRGTGVVGAATALLLSAAAVMSPTALAHHSHGDYYTSLWSSHGDEHRDVEYKFTSGFPNGKKKGAFQQAAQNLNAQKGTSYMYFDQDDVADTAPSQGFGTACPSATWANYQKNTVGYGSIVPNLQDPYLGQTEVCDFHSASGPTTPSCSASG